MKGYKDLKFWQKSFETTKQIVGLVKKLPMEQATKIVVNQLIRASSSVGANIAEGYGRYRGKEYERFLQISLGSANETEYWLLILKELYPKIGATIDKIIGINNETVGMLVSSLKTLRNKR
ncbi:MAG: hypothetical protein A3F04_00960 [Candidatus Chisholmbacteria bacterium RIFCSPHIGHO2_12_FULL_49_9]|uniref:Four helix bundle protein n=1 Tax=Candidatus Chisholmbacteria bacterium RIFCSPHIGHO2_01_FULL_52_32 TaxID=1797591 RepID=A0A1G1VUD9_9BACT|nr:MAG: hypothetical protein A2786_04215 [Candidatus Chisholmbacteria bacterium RIFCSPHIGHO2_01_FULL_52_32]OGY20622.1 MAG: hypothetical protein A2900_02530 [Candidatus Chisholmbacteria bacterium RIFCSPLOWO2_01_FULL_50_28]OGY20816.1 MAG: hypothetical protein A3F04_00960 [Candidatus Chisholmbacteria bacterium RIFCSPHIGHO2_12_FULL_49_9]